MKLVNRIALLVALASLSSLSIASEPSRWERIKGYAHTEKEAAVADGKKILAEADAKMADMKKQVAKANAETKAAHERNMADLKAKRDSAEKHMGKMKKSAKDAWGATRDGFVKASQDLHEAYDKAASAVKR